VTLRRRVRPRHLSSLSLHSFHQSLFCLSVSYSSSAFLACLLLIRVEGNMERWLQGTRQASPTAASMPTADDRALLVAARKLRLFISCHGSNLRPPVRSLFWKLHSFLNSSTVLSEQFQQLGLHWMVKAGVVASFKIPSQHLSGKAERLVSG
jgi:hypothetical protein